MGSGRRLLERSGAVTSVPGFYAGRAMEALTTLLYLLMRDHLPTGAVKELVDHAKLRTSAPDEVVREYSAPELEDLARRYAGELLSDEQRAHISISATDEEPEAAAPATASIAPRAIQVSDAICAKVLRYVDSQAGRGIKPGEIDEGAGVAKVTRSRAITRLAADGRIRVEGNRGSRRVFSLKDSTGSAEQQEPAEPGASPPEESATVDDDKHGLGESSAPTSEPDPDDAVEGDRPADPAVDAGEGNHDDGATREHRGSDDDGRESGSAVAVTTPPAQIAELADRVFAYIDEAEGDVFRTELEQALGIQSTARILATERLEDEGRIEIIAAHSAYTRFRSTRVRATPVAHVGDGTVHLRDAADDQAAAAKRERDQATIAAARALPAVREWLSGAGTFSLRQLRSTFDLEPAAASKLMASLRTKGLIEPCGEKGIDAYRAIGSKMTGSGGDGGTLASRVGGACAGDGLTITGVMARVGVSEEVAKHVLGKLVRDGDVRPRQQGGDLHYVAV